MQMNLRELYIKLAEGNQYDCPVCNNPCEFKRWSEYEFILACREEPFLAKGKKIHFCIIKNNNYKGFFYTYINLINGFEIFYKEFHENDSFKSLFIYNNPLNIDYSFEDGIDSEELEIELNFN